MCSHSLDAVSFVIDSSLLLFHFHLLSSSAQNKVTFSFV